MSSTVGRIQIGEKATDRTTFVGEVNVPEPKKPDNAATKRYVDSIGAVSMAVASAYNGGGEGNYIGLGVGHTGGQSAIAAGLRVQKQNKLIKAATGYSNASRTPSFSVGVGMKF